MTSFIIQYALTILTIILIPLMLWLGKKRDLRTITLIVFAVLALSNFVMWLISGRFAAYLYLAIIAVCSLFLVKKK